MRSETYFVLNGEPTIYKNPGACLLYGIDLEDWLAGAGTALESVKATAVGVSIVGEPLIIGTAVCAWIEGLDESDGAQNKCVFDFKCTDGKSADSRAIYFKKRPG